jgi:hypothetical protein
VPLEQVHDDRAVEDQQRRGHQEPAEVPAPEHRPDQADTEDHAHRRKQDGGQGERTGERVADRAPGQHAADGQVDPVDDRQANPDDPPEALDVMAEVPRRDQHEP